ncbi:MAG TPA: ABC transporter substrate-binding protein [Vicinamibacteria bacterium]|nr:ABC transporter substrate-binding protein [Vicinamibacteria bacterium]
MTRTGYLAGAALLCSALSTYAETGVTPEKVVLGQPAAFSGPSAGLGVEMWRGAWAAFQEANDAGGVHGRKIQLVLADDAYDAERAAPAVTELVRARVFALFGGVGTPTIVKALPVVLENFNKDGLFYFANFTGAQAQREAPFERCVFNLRASYRQETEAMVAAFSAMGRRKIAIFVQDDAYGASGRDGVRRALAARNLSLVADTTYRRGQRFEASTMTQVEAIRAAGAEAVIAVGAYQACAAFVRDARNAGLTIPIHNVSFVGPDQMLALLRDEEKRTGKRLTANLIVTQVVPSYLDTRIPVVSAYRMAMNRYDPTIPPGIGDGSYRPGSRYSFGSLEGYVSAKAFLAVLRKVGPELTRKRFYETAESMGRFELGLEAPAEFSAGRHQALDKVWFTYVAESGWVTTRTAALQ